MNLFKAVVALACLTIPVACLAEAKTIFKGRPEFVISEFGFMREAGPVDAAKASMAEVVISEIDGTYYWASRENRELRRIVGGSPVGAIVTYHAVDGSGYIRIVVDPGWKANMRTRFPDYDLDYTEHMLQALGSHTYFGKERIAK